MCVYLCVNVWVCVCNCNTEDAKFNTVEPLYNEVLGIMKITLLYQVSHYIRVKKQRNIKSWDQQNYLVIRGFCYIRPRYNEVPLYQGHTTRNLAIKRGPWTYTLKYTTSKGGSSLVAGATKPRISKNVKCSGEPKNMAALTL